MHDYRGLHIAAAPGLHEAAFMLLQRHVEPCPMLDLGCGAGAFTQRSRPRIVRRTRPACSRALTCFDTALKDMLTGPARSEMVASEVLSGAGSGRRAASEKALYVSYASPMLCLLCS